MFRLAWGWTIGISVALVVGCQKGNLRPGFKTECRISQSLDIISVEPAIPPKAGQLTLIRGFELRSSDPGLSELSGLLVTRTCDALWAVTDNGFWVELALPIKPVPSGTQEGTLAEVCRIPENVTQMGFGNLHDAEGLAWGKRDEVLVSFEQVHRLVSFRSGALPRVIEVPGYLSASPSNGGLESITRLQDGRFLTISEKLREEHYSVGAIWNGTTWEKLLYEAAPEYRVTGLATLYNGDVLVLERFYKPREGNKNRVVRVLRHSLKSGSVIRGELILDMAPPALVDNFEGIATCGRDERDTQIFLVSDNNKSSSQRTLLYQFSF